MGVFQYIIYLLTTLVVCNGVTEQYQIYATPDPLCPFPSNEITYFVDPYDCSKYYECFEGNKYSMSCPAGLYWNNKLDVCDYPSQVDCSYVSSSTVSPPTGVTRDPTCPYPSNVPTFYPHAYDCTRYYECLQGNKQILTCPAGTAWSVAINACDILANVDCSYTSTTSRTTTTTTTTTTQAPITSTSRPTPDPSCPYPSNIPTYYPHRYNCSMFYECLDGSKYLLTCPAGTAWSVSIDACDLSSNVDCSYTSTTSTTTVATTPGGWTPDPLCPYPSDVVTYYPHPYECSYFYECIEGTRYLLPCPAGYLWNNVLHACDIARNVDCSYTSTSVPTTTTSRTTTAPPSRCDTVPDGTFFPHPTDCHKFIECISGQEYVFNCQDGTAWDQATTTCVKSDGC